MRLSLGLGLPGGATGVVGPPPWLPIGAEDAAMGIDFTVNGAFLAPDNVPISSLLTITRLDGAGGSTAETVAGEVKSFGTDELRITDKGILIEEARTNALLQSEDFSTTWTPGNGATVNTNVAQSPRDVVDVTMDEIVDDSAIAYLSVIQSVTILDDLLWQTGYVYILKDQDETRFPSVRLELRDGTLQSIEARINTKTGVTDTDITGTATHSVEDKGLWWRVILSVQNNNTGNVTGRMIVYAARGIAVGGNNVTAEGSVIVWGAQLEVGAFATSYIPTTGVAATRAADQVTFSDQTWYVATDGTFLVNTVDFANGDATGIVRVLAGTSSELFFSKGSATTVAANATVGGSISATFGSGNWLSAKSSLGYDPSGRSIVGNYGDVESDAVIVGAITTITLGASGSFALPINGFIEQLFSWTDRKTDGILQWLTNLNVPADWVSVGSSMDMDFAFNRYWVGDTGVTADPTTILTTTRVTTLSYAEQLDGSLVSFAADLPRITDKGLLVEESRVNLVLRSQEMDTLWGTTNTVVSDPNTTVTTAPDGTNTADFYREASDTGAQHYLVQNLAAAGVSTISAYFKAGTRTKAMLYDTGAGKGIGVDLVAGTLFTPTGFSSSLVVWKLEKLPDGWYHVSGVKDVSLADLTGLRLYLVDDTDNPIYDGDGVSGLYVWGVQVEVGAFPTSYIPTLTVAASRAEDKVSFTDFTTTWRSREGTAFIQALRQQESSLGCLFSLRSSNSVNTSMEINLPAGTDDALFISKPDGGGAHAAITMVDAAPAGSVHKLAFRLEDNDQNVATDGVAFGTPDVTGIQTHDVSNLATLGSLRNFVQFANVYIERVSWFPDGKTDAELITLTTL